MEINALRLNLIKIWSSPTRNRAALCSPIYPTEMVYGSKVWILYKLYNWYSAEEGTIGLILSGEDMPQTAEGLRPDIIINPHCLSAMTPITLSNGEVKYIKDIFNEKKMDIKTIDPISLKVSNTKFKDGFVIKSRELKQLTTISGRIIKCTPDHKFLVLNNGKLIWKETRDIIPYCDKMVIHHSILPVPSNDGVNLEITEGEGSILG